MSKTQNDCSNGEMIKVQAYLDRHPQHHYTGWTVRGEVPVGNLFDEGDNPKKLTAQMLDDEMNQAKIASMQAKISS